MERKSSARTWVVVGLLAVANIIAYIDRTNLSVAIATEDFRKFFSLSDALRGDLSSAFFWSYAFLQVPAGALADRYGVKAPLAISFLIWSLVSAATGWANALWQLFALRILLGVGEAVITPGSLRWIRFNVDERHRGLANGIFFAGAKLGPAIGTWAAAALLTNYGWRQMFVILGLGCLVWLVPWMIFAGREERPKQTPAAAAAAAATAVPFSAVFRTPAIYGIIIGTFAYNYFNYFCLTWLPSYFVEQWNMSLASMSWYAAFSFGGMAIVAIAAGSVADGMIARGADAIKVRKGFTLAGLAIASTELIGVMSGSRELAVIFAVVSLSGLGLATANYWALTQTLMPGPLIGRVTGVQNFASNLSGIVAPVLTGRLVAWTGSYLAPMQAIAVLLAAGFLSYVFLVRKEYAPQAPKSQVVAR